MPAASYVYHAANTFEPRCVRCRPQPDSFAFHHSPVSAPGDVAAAAVAIAGGAMNDQTYDPQITVKIAGTIILALVTVFILQAAGFRFVGAVNVGVGK